MLPNINISHCECTNEQPQTYAYSASSRRCGSFSSLCGHVQRLINTQHNTAQHTLSDGSTHSHSAVHTIRGQHTPTLTVERQQRSLGRVVRESIAIITAEEVRVRRDAKCFPHAGSVHPDGQGIVTTARVVIQRRLKPILTLNSWFGFVGTGCRTTLRCGVGDAVGTCLLLEMLNAVASPRVVPIFAMPDAASHTQAAQRLRSRWVSGYKTCW